MLGVGLAELIIILLIALLVVGPERLPELAAQAGRLVRDLRRMYANLRAELGPEFDDIERTIHELRALDPRRQISAYGRDLLDDLARDAPEIRQVSTQRRLNLEQLSREVLDDALLERPLAETRAAHETASVAFAVPRATPSAPPSAAAPAGGEPAGSADPDQTAPARNGRQEHASTQESAWHYE